MPVYDIRCPACGHTQIDVIQPIYAEQPRCNCGAQMERAWLTKPSNVVGDECDVWVRHGICNEDGSPRHYRSKAEMARVAKEKNFVNYVQHLPFGESDKSPHTSNWAAVSDLSGVESLIKRVHG